MGPLMAKARGASAPVASTPRLASVAARLVNFIESPIVIDADNEIEVKKSNRDWRNDLQLCFRRFERTRLSPI